MYKIGIIQGRLSPSPNNRFQFFPSDWEAEFLLAKEMGFDHIAWFLDRDIPGFDPVNDIWLNSEVIQRIDKSRQIIPISSVDAGRYPTCGPARQDTISQFKKLLPVLIPRLSTGVVNIPLLEDHAPKTPAEKLESIDTLKQILAVAKSVGGRIGIETEMPVAELKEFIDGFNDNSIGVCYDTGNCASYGFDCAKDIEELGSRIFEVHLKDRKSGSTQSLTLGTGDANFKECFATLDSIGYCGIFTLQAWRGEDYLADASAQLSFIRQLLNT